MKLKILNLQNLSILLTTLVALWVTAMKTEPFLHYHFQQIGFLTTFDFFKPFTTYPGGIADYVAEFISQLFSFNLFGSALIVAIAALQGLIALNLITRITGNTKLGYTLFSIVLLSGVIIVSDYRYPYYISIRLLLAFVFVWAYYILYSKLPKLKLIVWTIAGFLLFYIASGPALFVFTLSTAAIIIYTEKTKTWLKVIPAMLIFAGILPLVGYKFLFQVTLQNLYNITVIKPPELLAYSTYYQLYIYYSLLPAILCIFLFLVRIPEKEQAVSQPKRKTKPQISFYKKMPFILSVQVAGIAVIGYFLFIKTHEPFKKKILLIEYYAENQQWDKLLKVAEEIEIYDFRVNFQINRAYANLGQLPERLFTYPQLLGVNGLFFDNSNMNGSFTMPNSDLYFDLGLMSESQHWAFEAQTLMPNSPRILKRLIMINLINRKYQLAQEFLTVLDQNMLYHKWVDKYKKYVSDTTLAAADKLIAEKRRFNPQKEYVHIEPLNDLKLLFETNKENRFAFDYLLSHCILSSNYPDFMNYLPYFKKYNIKTLPRSWEEALAINILKTKTIPDFVTAETISDGCMKRIGAFNKTVTQFNNDLQAAKNTLRRYFEDTYWYYMLYLDPKVTNVLTNKSQVR